VNKKLIPILTLLVLLVSISYSQTRPRESLRGRNGVYVYVQPVGKDVEAGGLSTSNVQKAVETYEGRNLILSQLKRGARRLGA
jgi:hypothetical protein